MSLEFNLRRFALAALMVFGTAASGGAQTVEADDPPGRVGRLAYMEGTVSFRAADADQWEPATLNYPITTGDGLWTEPAARAEIQIGSADLRLDPTTAIQILRLDDGATRIQVDQGSVNLRLRDLPPGGVQIVTPRGTLTALRPGRYHVDMAAPQGDADGDQARFAVLEGQARVDGLPGSAVAPLTVSAGHSATLRADGSPPLLAQAIARPLDTWALERERLLNPQQTVRYVSPEMTGYQDLDRYGQWTQEPEYGAIWYPRVVAVDWAPYRYGHWAYVRPWGWTWIDHQPWGFAPFHYGRWVRVRDRWGWHPGTRIARPVYAPALVAFIGGSNFSVSIVAGRRAPAVGWVPLGPREIYRPHYRHSPTYVRNVNITNVNVTNVTVINRDGRGRGGDWDDDRRSIRDFRNREALTVVSSDSFTRAESVSRARVTVRDDDVADVRRRDSLDDLRPSRAARSGATSPTAARAEGVAGPPRGRTTADDRQRANREERGGERAAAPAGARNGAAQPSDRRDSDLPAAPGPRRDSRVSRDNRDSGQPSRAPEQGQSDRARPTAGAPGPDSSRSRASISGSPAAPGPRAAQPPGRSPRDTSARAPSPRPPSAATRPPEDTGRDSRAARPNDQPARPQAVPPDSDRGRRENRASGRGADATPNQPRSVAPAPAPSAERQTPPRIAAPGPAARPTADTRNAGPPQATREARREPVARQDSAPARPAQMQQQPSRQPSRETFERREQPQASPQPVMRQPEPRREVRPQPQSAPQPVMRQSEPRREVRPQPQPQARPQPVARQPEPRREARPQPQAQPQASAPRDTSARQRDPAPRRVQQPTAPRPQEAQKPGNNNRKRDEQRRDGG